MNCQIQYLNNDNDNDNDIDLLNDIITIQQQGLPEKTWSVSECQKMLDAPNLYQIVTISKDDVLLGFAFLTLYNSDLNLTTIVIDKKQRKQNYGSILLASIIDWAHDHGYDTISLEVKAGNSPAINLYQKLNFQINKKIPNYYKINDQYFDAFEMILLLN